MTQDNNMTDTNNFDFAAIPQIKLSKGSHASPQQGTCFYEAVAFFAGEKHTDRPECACPVLTSYGISLNDNMPDDVRNELLIPMIGLVAGTRDHESEQKRAEFLAVWAVNKIVPIALRTNGLDDHAKACEDAQTLSDARAAADAAYDAARAAAYAADAAAYAAYDAADAAAYAAYDAARAAAYAADAADAAAYAAYDAADAAADAAVVWTAAVEGLRQAVLIGRHDGFATDPALKVDAFVKATTGEKVTV